MFEIPPISLDPDSALTEGDVVSHFGELSESAGGPSGAGNLARNAVVGGNDPSFASTYVNPNSQGLEHLSLGVMSQSGGAALLSSTLGVVSRILIETYIQNKCNFLDSGLDFRTVTDFFLILSPGAWPFYWFSFQ